MSAPNNFYSEGLVIQSQTQNQNLDEYVCVSVSFCINICNFSI